MFDPEEGLAPDGTILTGARRDRVPAQFEPVLASAVAAFGEVSDTHSELHLYGSVATGMARLGASDVDMLAIGVPAGWARDVSDDLSRRFMALCRGVEIGQGEAADFRGQGSAAYGGQVFLRHYCVPIAGPNAVRRVRPFLGDAQAARGFNGDIAECLNRWRSGADPRRVARKTLLAAAGFVSVRYGTWTTDRSTAARRWAQLDPGQAGDIAEIFTWAEGRCTPSASHLNAVLGQNGAVAVAVERFAADVGLWSDLDT